MTDPKKAPKAPLNVAALKLSTAGNPPDTWHTVSGLPGHFHPAIPTPLDQPGGPTTEQAETFITAHKDTVALAVTEAAEFRKQRLEDGFGDPGEFVEPACPVELVNISEPAAEKANGEIADHHRLARRALRDAAKAGDAALPHVQAQDAAITTPIPTDAPQEG